VKSYLDELLSDPAADPTDRKHKEQVITTASQRYFPQSVNFSHDLYKAFDLWGAIFEGVTDVNSPMPDSTKKFWKETNEWLATRR